MQSDRVDLKQMPKSDAVRSAYARLIQWSGPAVIAAAFLGLSLWTWRKWPDILVDFGRELYIPWQLSFGKVLYTDIAYFNGPLSPYLNSVWFRLFGVSITTLIFANLAIIATLTWIMYRMFRDACDRLTGTMVGLIFVCVFAFSQYTPSGSFSFVCPYSHELTHGILLTVAMIYFLSCHVQQRKLRTSLAAGLLLGLVFLTKAEVFLAATAAAAVGFWLLCVCSRCFGRQTGLALFAFVGAAFLPISSFFVFLSMQMSARQALRGIAGTWTPLLTTTVAYDPHYRLVMGLDRPESNLVTMIRVFIGIMLLIGAVAAADIDRGVRKGTRLLIGASFFLFVAALLVKQYQEPLLGRFWRAPIPWLLIGWALPFITLAAGAMIAILCIRRPVGEQIAARLAPLLMWSAFAFVLLGKIILYPRVYHYGQTLAMPATVLLVVCFVWLIPELLATALGGGDRFRRFAVAMLATDMIFYLAISSIYYSRKDYLVGHNGDTIATYGPHTDVKGIATTQVLQRIKSLMPLGASFVVLPEGVMLNYLSRHPNPTPYVNFMPPELRMFGEANIVDSFKSRPPDYIVLAHRETSEYDVGYFGSDSRFGKKIMDWVNSHYVTVERILSEPLKDRRFGIEIRERRG